MRFALLLLLIIPAFSHAEIFYWEDENGKKHFSDRKHENATVVDIQTAPSYYPIKKVYDGDTVLLENGIKVRFLGINTPEVAKRDKVADAGGEEAKQWLAHKLEGTKVKLRYDSERKDKYGRTLAYLFTENNEHLNLQLVRNGLATVNIYPPNLKYANELIAAQQQAESQRLGIWGLSEYAPKTVGRFDSSKHRGWQRITGRISKIKQTKKYNYLQLTPKFALKIARNSENLFPNINSYLGKSVEARGWVNKNKQRYSMFIRHPSAINLK
ncbi:MAG: DUF4124 domain-containing protein [Methylococcaceae bacterium]|nr:DUF4124 domain-containing protein [Methylococcaceae bacterium]